MYRRDQLYKVPYARVRQGNPGTVTIRYVDAAHEPAREASSRISTTDPNDIWLKGFMKPISVSSEDDWQQLKDSIRTDSTEGCDVRTACSKGVIPIAISYKWQSNDPTKRMSDVQFRNLRYTIRFHFAHGDMNDAKVSFWLDQHMRKNVGERERRDWMSYGTTAYRNSIVCYLPNVDITHGNDNPRIHTASEPVDVSAQFEADTRRLWIAFELRRATQGVGLMCGSYTELGVSNNLVLDGPKTMIDMWECGFITGGRLSNAEAAGREKADILSGRLIGINDSWDDFLKRERERLFAEGIVVTDIKRYKHMTEAGTYEFSDGGEFENEYGLSSISVCDIGPGQHSTSSFLVVRDLPIDVSWNEGGLLIAGDFPDDEKRREVARVPMTMIGANPLGNPGESRYLWVGHVSTKNVEKYCCVVVGLRHCREFSARVVQVIDIWPINSHIYDAAVYGSREGALGVIGHLQHLNITDEFWGIYVSLPPYISALASEVMERATFERLLED